MQKANGRQRQNSYRFKPRDRDMATEKLENQIDYRQTDFERVQRRRIPFKSGNSKLRDTGQSSDMASGSSSSTCRSIGIGNKDLNQERRDSHVGFELISDFNSKVNLDSDACNDEDSGWETIQTKSKRAEQRKLKQGVLLPCNFDLSKTNTRMDSTACDDHSVGVSSLNAKSKGDAQEQKHKSPKSCQPESSEEKIPATNTNDKPKKKKKKKPIGTPEERRLKRDLAVWNEIYKPKDSHVHVLTPEQFKLIKEGKTPTAKNVNSVPKTSFLKAVNSFKPNVSPYEFPDLADTKESKSKHPKTLVVEGFLKPESSVSDSAVISTSEDIPSGRENMKSPQHEQETEVSTETKNRVKLSKRPIMINIEDLLKKSPVVIPDDAIASTSTKKVDSTKHGTGNLLDSTAPIVFNRGKIRQKKKRLTKTKKLVLKSREVRKFITSITSANFGLQCSNDVSQAGDSLSTQEITQPAKEHKSTPNESVYCKNDLKTTQTLSCTNDCTNSSQKENLHPITNGIEKNDSVEGNLVSINSSTDDTKEEESAEQIDVGEKFSNIIKSVEAELDRSRPAPELIKSLVKVQMHNRKFRPYCDMFLTKDFHFLIFGLMRELHRLQDRVYKTEPHKLAYKRRYLIGIREVVNSLKLNKAQLVIIAPDIEPNGVEGGLDEKIKEIIQLAAEKHIPYVFSGSRFTLGRCVMQYRSPVSAMAVIDKNNVEDKFHEILDAAQALKRSYQENFQKRVSELTCDLNLSLKT